MTKLVESLGARILQIPNGYLSVVQARARDYCAANPSAKLLPFGLADPVFVDALAEIARALPVVPTEVWTAVGSGTLTNALQYAWPRAQFFGVAVGAVPKFTGKARIYAAPEAYEQPAQEPPPFPSCGNYDAKVWRFIKQRAQPGALFWNVA
jgi:hypothetical protein